jgi:hypothetical protein
MRVNVYAEEMTERVEIISKTIDGHEFTGLRIYLELPASLPKDVYLAGPTPAVNSAYAEPPTETTRNVQGPFMHRPGDDDSSAVTFWGKRDLRAVLRKMLAQLDTHYGPGTQKKVVYIAHALGAGPDRESNRAKASRWVAWAAETQGVAPVADWIILSGQWDESHRDFTGLRIYLELPASIDVALVARCDEVWLCGGRVSPGMTVEGKEAKRLGKPVFDLSDLGSEPPTGLGPNEMLVMTTEWEVPQ